MTVLTCAKTFQKSYRPSKHCGINTLKASSVEATNRAHAG